VLTLIFPGLRAPVRGEEGVEGTSPFVSTPSVSSSWRASSGSASKRENEGKGRERRERRERGEGEERKRRESFS